MTGSQAASTVETKICFTNLTSGSTPRRSMQLRKGDCEDFAIWAWRKLIEIGVDAHLFIGERASEAKSRHAWVVFTLDDQRLLFEPQASRDRMLHRFEEVKGNYIPYVFVNRSGKVVAVEGYLHYLKRRDLVPDPGWHAA